MKVSLIRFLFLVSLCGCVSGAPNGGGDPIGGLGGPGSSSPNGTIPGNDPNNPATRPTPGFTELEMAPATSTTLPPPASFLKGLVIVDNLIEITDVRMVLRDVILQDGSDFSSPGPFIVRLIRGDLIVDETFPDFGTQAVAQGAYDQTDVGFALLNANQIPPELEDDPLVTGPLVGNSIVVEGKLDLDILGPLLKALLEPVLGDFLRFRFVSDQTVDVRIETLNAFNLDQSAQTLFIAFKVKTWVDTGLFDILIDLLEDLNLFEILDLLVGNLLVFDTSGNNPTLQGIALTIETNINTSLRFAPSADAVFQEGDVLEDSFSDVFP